MIYFTSDLHFNHNKNFIYESRGYNSIYEHDRDIIKIWNSIVNIKDEVYFLGDIGLGSDIDYLCRCVGQLNCSFHWIYGNHDTLNRVKEIEKCWNVVSEGYSIPLKYKGYRFWLSHYPTMCAPIGEKPVSKSLISLCGHTHTDNCFSDWDKYMIYHVDWDAHKRLISVEEIIEDIRSL